MNSPKHFHTQVSNDFIDKFMSQVSGSATKVFLTISRNTIGWHKDTDSISISQIQAKTGLSNRCVIDAVRELEKIGIIIVEKKFITRYTLNYEKLECEESSQSENNLCEESSRIQNKIVKKVHKNSEESSHTKDIIKIKNNIKKESLSACADEEEIKEKDPLLSVKTGEENIDPITNNSFSLITYMYDRIEEEHNKLTPQDPYKRNEDFFIRKLFDTIDKETFDGKLSALITRIKNTKNKEFLLTLTAKTLLNKLNELQIVAEPPKVNNRFKSGNVRPATRSLTLREQILSTPGLASKYCLADVYEDEEERGINSAECIKLECYSEV